jgi:hypothetical protein
VFNCGMLPKRIHQVHNRRMSETDGVNRSEVINDGMSVSESAFISKANPAGETVGFVVSRDGDDPRVAASDLGEDGRLLSRVEGRASNKKASELRTAQLFVQRLNAIGARWGEVSPPSDELPEEGVDAIARDSDGQVLKIQVTTPETRAWRHQAKQTEPWSVDEEIQAAVEALHDAIHRKHLKAHPDTHLVLDATDSPRFALTSVVRAFRERYGAWARGRFAEVWIVGPVVDSVERLDV